MSDLHLFMQRDPSRADEMLGGIWLSPNGFMRDYQKPFVYTLEDEHREEKIAGETAIPAGIYPIQFRPLGQSRMDASYKARYGDMYQGQLWLQDVPNFTYVYIHTGNNDDHTDGCILVGMNKYEDAIGASRTAYKKLYPIIAEAINDPNRNVIIEIRDAA